MKYMKRSEDTEQMAVVSWARWNVQKYPELKWLYHVPNGGSRNRAEAAKFKQMGVKAGVADLCLPYPKGAYCGLWIEMKYGRNTQQETQKEFLEDMAAAGHFVATCYSAREACEVIEEYCKLPAFGEDECIYRNLHEYQTCEQAEQEFKRNMMSFANNSILKDGKILKGKKE
ncbi:MAG: VRR-NUC domain-containing protein [Roseburia faecis]|jgi:hypothetical protein|nr:MAG TPA: Nuclease [Caudoviricetes sp.]